MIRKLVVVLLAITAVVVFTGCQVSQQNSDNVTVSHIAFTDDLGNVVTLNSKPTRVISLLGSYSEMWIQAGGELVGVTEDAVSERGLELPKEVINIGGVKEPNVELILSIKPDFVLLSTDVKSHLNLADTLTKAKISHSYFKEDTAQDYLRIFSIFTDITKRKDLFAEYGEGVIFKIEQVKSTVPIEVTPPKVLLIRSMSTKAKALKDDHMVGIMLADLKADNIATRHNSLLEDLSMEEIIAENPDYIFVVTMGDVDKAVATLENGIMKNPAWGNLSAVENGNYHVLPKDLFQYKPNARWGESYEYLAKILYK